MGVDGHPRETQLRSEFEAPPATVREDLCPLGHADGAALGLQGWLKVQET